MKKKNLNSIYSIDLPEGYSIREDMFVTTTDGAGTVITNPLSGSSGTVDNHALDASMYSLANMNYSGSYTITNDRETLKKEIKEEIMKELRESLIPKHDINDKENQDNTKRTSK